MSYKNKSCGVDLHFYLLYLIKNKDSPAAKQKSFKINKSQYSNCKTPFEENYKNKNQKNEDY